MLPTGAVVWLGVIVLPYLFSYLSSPYSLSTHHPLLKKRLIYQNNGMLEQKFIFSLISSMSQSRTMNLKISLLLHWLTSLPLIYSVIYIVLS